MQLSKLAPDKQGYLCDPETGEKVKFWPCDPSKNILCTKTMCRGCSAEGEDEIGFCASTPEPAFAKDGSRPFYKKLKPDGVYYGREYLEEAESDA